MKEAHKVADKERESAILALLQRRADAEGRLYEAKDELSFIDGQLAELVDPDVDRALDEAGKPHGTVHIQVGNHRLTFEVGKTVTWDSGRLESIAGTLDYERARKLFKITFKMDEKTYEGVHAAALTGGPEAQRLADDIATARTVRFSEPKLKKVD